MFDNNPNKHRRCTVKKCQIDESADFFNVDEPELDYKFSLLNHVNDKPDRCPLGVLLTKEVFDADKKKILTFSVLSEFYIINEGRPISSDDIYDCVITAQKDFIVEFGKKKKEYQKIKDLFPIIKLKDALLKRMEIAIMRQGQTHN
jgi:hypothetical protein